jgi:hypothetical protein
MRRGWMPVSRSRAYHAPADCRHPVLAVGPILVLLGSLGRKVGAVGVTSEARGACCRTVCQHALPQLVLE